jgi:hypothetical protein
VLVALTALALGACFGPPQLVAIDGYHDHAMEPFITRDGEALFFNNRNEPAPQTDLHWASRLDATHFRYRGRVSGANSDHLDGVPSLARDGTFAFVSLRAFADRHATLWSGRWQDGLVSQLALQTALSPGPPPRFNMDAEISAAGAHLYFTDNLWGFIGPRTSDLRLAVRAGDGFRRAPEFDRWFAQVNTRAALEFAPATSEDELELYFTRLTMHFPLRPQFEIMAASRTRADEPFGAPERIAALTGYVEAPSVAPDGALYFHAKIGEAFRIMRTPRTCPRR